MPISPNAAYATLTYSDSYRFAADQQITLLMLAYCYLHNIGRKANGFG